VIKRTKPVKRTNPKRRKKNHERAYGGTDRIEWIKSLKCVVCESSPCENAHTQNGGMGRKGDADSVVPMCHDHHAMLHSLGRETFEDLFFIDMDKLSLSQLAARIECRWQAYQESQPKRKSA
jgi:hypothetical protein